MGPSFFNGAISLFNGINSMKNASVTCQINYLTSQREESFGLRLGLEKTFLVTATKKHLPHGGNMFVGDSRA
jgi:hypothetical protein